MSSGNLLDFGPSVCEFTNCLKKFSHYFLKIVMVGALGRANPPTFFIKIICISPKRFRHTTSKTKTTKQQKTQN